MVAPVVLSAPVPPDLTHSQVWQGLQIKARNEVGFMPAFLECQPLGTANATTGSFLRRSKMQELHSGDPVEVVEEVTEFSPTMVHYRRFDNAAEVFNTISRDPKTGELVLTFSYHLKFSQVPGSPDEEELYQKARRSIYETNCLMKTLGRIRRLVAEGTLG
ncbi:hypothetical protein DL93DRAFT_1069646 [Clavulina sp. PMI_390]|nr:hypothetical protein DL93DRAFT_1069646 [Clavulina sp. PMI_390]